MRTIIFSFSLGLSLLISACGGTEPASRSNQNSGAPDNTGRAEKPGGNASREVGVSSSHGGGGGASGTSAVPAAGGGDAERSALDTAELDARIEKAVVRAKATGASVADKKAAADAYLARGNEYYQAGNPRLYKFALGDFRRVLRYQPENDEAKAKVKEIEDIYTYSVKKPIPNNGLEP